MAKEWIIQPPDDACPELARRWNLPPIVTQLLLNRGVKTEAETRAFIHPQLKDLHPPDALPGVRAAASIMADALRQKRKIVLYGDYDVDGITGVSVLWHVLRAAGGQPSLYVPHRLEEGYGLNGAAIRSLASEGAALIVTVDCGIGSADEARVARECGVQLIITDHHNAGPNVPEAVAIVHPRVGGSYPNPAICGAGVAFKLAWAIGQELSGADKVAPKFRRQLSDLLPLVALGTIADVVPLLEENRIFARHGLAALKETQLVGLLALMASAGLTGEVVSGYDVGFKLAPRLNAAGRMGHALLAVELLTRADASRAQEIALYLEEHNRARQAKERKILKAACEMVEQRRLDRDACRGIVLASDGWHAGVIGIVASRIVEKYHRPAVLIALENGLGQGSARSISGLDLHEALGRCSEYLEQFGGHAMAGGLRIKDENVPAFTEAFIACANNTLTGADIRPKLRLDAEVALGELDLRTVQAILNLGPFGQGNPAPLLATAWVDLAAEPRCVGESGTHLTATFRDADAVLRAIAFGRAADQPKLQQHRRCRVAFEPIINDFNGRRTVEMRVADFQFPGDSL